LRAFLLIRENLSVSRDRWLAYSGLVVAYCHPICKRMSLSSEKIQDQNKPCAQAATQMPKWWRVTYWEWQPSRRQECSGFSRPPRRRGNARGQGGGGNWGQWRSPIWRTFVQFLVGIFFYTRMFSPRVAPSPDEGL